MWWRNRGLLLGITILLALLLPIVRYVNRSDVAHRAIQTWLRLYGSGINEYHSRTGRWPSRTEDLAETSLPQQSRYWKRALDDRTIVIVWHKDLGTVPEDNAGLILAYHNRGLYARLGRVWVCRGDLRTEYITVEELRAYLEARKDKSAR
jgi:hypothetical protein